MQCLLPAQKAGAGVLSSLVTFALPVWPEIFLAPDPPPDPIISLVFLGQSIEPTFTGFTKSFDRVTSGVILAYFAPQGDVCMFCCT